jgi:hypothetical protein
VKKIRIAEKNSEHNRPFGSFAGDKPETRPVRREAATDYKEIKASKDGPGK